MVTRMRTLGERYDTRGLLHFHLLLQPIRAAHGQGHPSKEIAQCFVVMPPRFVAANREARPLPILDCVRPAGARRTASRGRSIAARLPVRGKAPLAAAGPTFTPPLQGRDGSASRSCFAYLVAVVDLLCSLPLLLFGKEIEDSRPGWQLRGAPRLPLGLRAARRPRERQEMSKSASSSWL